MQNFNLWYKRLRCFYSFLNNIHTYQWQCLIYRLFFDFSGVKHHLGEHWKPLYFWKPQKIVSGLVISILFDFYDYWILEGYIFDILETLRVKGS